MSSIFGLQKPFWLTSYCVTLTGWCTHYRARSNKPMQQKIAYVFLENSELHIEQGTHIVNLFYMTKIFLYLELWRKWKLKIVLFVFVIDNSILNFVTFDFFYSNPADPALWSLLSRVVPQYTPRNAQVSYSLKSARNRNNMCHCIGSVTVFK